VTKDEHENYKEIKANLDQLRLLVEKSELWVYKGKTVTSASSHDATHDARRDGVKLNTSSLSSVPAVNILTDDFCLLFIPGWLAKSAA